MIPVVGFSRIRTRRGDLKLGSGQAPLNLLRDCESVRRPRDAVAEEPYDVCEASQEEERGGREGLDESVLVVCAV